MISNGKHKIATASCPSVNLEMRSESAAEYKSPAQRARIVSEAWVRDNVYCPACDSENLTPTPPGMRVIDFTCESCPQEYQLKAQRHQFGRKVLDAAYGPMIERIMKSKAPNFIFLRYDVSRWRACDLIFVPHFFVTPSAIERRPPLRKTARRAGWEGCNILLDTMPPDARIVALVDESEIPSDRVREAWRRFSFLERQDVRSRGWVADVLACIRSLGRGEFSLADAYAFEGHLSRLHPENRNVRPKIRQQLQVLRDRGLMQFLGRGRYRILLLPQLD